MTAKSGFVRSITAAETAQAHATMADCFAQIEQWHEFVSVTRPVAASSALGVADRLTEPFQSSHTVSFNILTAVDHLHALRALLVDAKAQHIFAPYSLVRSAIENAATALWIMTDSHPRAIAVRSLKIEHANHVDVTRAHKTLGLVVDPTRDKLLEAVITKNGMKRDGIKANPPGFLKIVEEAAAAHDLGKLPGLMWQMCSAATHGRNWSSVILAMMEAEDDMMSKTLSGRLTSDEKAIAQALQIVGPLLDRTLRMQLSRCSATGTAGESFIKPQGGLLLPSHMAKG